MNHKLLVVTLSLAAALGANVARADDTADYFGRWTIVETKPVFSSNGRLYKTFDVAPCGNDFCGVSVADNGDCGPTLFRFYTIHAKDLFLNGHGRWGAGKKKLLIDFLPKNDAAKTPVGLRLGLGAENVSLEGREGSLPIFQGDYKKAGAAQCKLGTS